jgi:hypothetical protein
MRMTYRTHSPLAALLPMLALIAAGCGGSDKEIWRGTSGGYTITWRADDIVAGNGTDRQFSVRERLTGNTPTRPGDPITPAQAIEGLRREQCTGDEKAALLSAVGTLVTYRESSTLHCPQFTRIGDDYRVIDLAHPDSSPSLTTIFGTDDLYRALMQSPLVKRTLAREQWNIAAPPPPSSFDELMQRLHDITPECEFQLPYHSFSGFAFHHLVPGDSIAVWVDLPAGQVQCADGTKQMELVLPIPPGLRAAIMKAANGEDGILMRELQKSVGDRISFIASI